MKILIPFMSLSTSRELKEVKAKLSEYTENVAIHLAYCFLYGDSGNDLNHWMNEILASLRKSLVFHRVKTAKKYLTRDQWIKYFKNPLLEDLEDLEHLIRVAIVHHENESPILPFRLNMTEKERLFSFMEVIYLHFIDQVVARKQIDNEEIRSFIVTKIKEFRQE